MSKKSKVTVNDITPWVSRRKSFTTGQVSKQFKVTLPQARALVAVLRIKEIILPSSGCLGRDGTSLWRTA